MARSSSGESVLERIVRILDALTPESPALSVSEFARRANLPLPTASRLVAELVEHGLLARAPDRRVWIGVRLWELGARASPTLLLRETAMPAPATVTDPRELRSLLATVRRDGFVLGPGFIDSLAAGIAVPVRRAGGQVVGALSVIVPHDEHAVTRMPVVAAAAHDIEQRLRRASAV